ncbi:MAG TPA: glycoside hydrolase family 13 protein [Candidatus Alectryocaccobium stercorigallinarum]|nr:glycoside hydrolase family 13 protein [Candidatus Alectryocaccobium stercorigallinarum]
MEQRSLFCDQTEFFLTPCEPQDGDTVTFRFRTGRYQASFVFLHYADKAVRLEWDHYTNDFDYYSTDLKIGNEKFTYYFEINAENEICYYGKKGVVFRREEITPFEIIPGFTIPGWLKGAVMYQIFTDRFCSGETSNDVRDGEYMYYDRPVKKVADWNELPSTFDVGNFHGGDIQGIISKLDHLKELGVEVLYLNPVFLSPSNHKYDIEDYDHVDPHIAVMEYPEKGRTAIENLEASDALLARLISEAHLRKMKVILDGVFNHCSHFSKWMDVGGVYVDKDGKRTGAYGNPGSRYNDYFIFEDEYNIDYECWWDNINLPKLNYEGSKELFDDIMRVAEKWVSEPYNADGWRLDVASDLGHSPEYNHMFWREFRKHVKKANPNAVIIAEHYDNAAPWLDGSQWDTVMNYRAFMDPVSWFFTGMEKHSDYFREDLLGNSEAFEAAMTGCGAEFTGQSLFCAMNQLDNHDHSRFITRTNHKVMRLNGENHVLAEEDTDINIYMMAVVMQMTWPGAPCLYYGNETALAGFTDPDNRRAYPWGRENSEVLDFYKRIISLRSEYGFLRHASNRVIYAKDGILAYARFTEEEQMIAVFSMENDPVEVDMPVWMTGRAGYLEEDHIYRIFYCCKTDMSYEKRRYELRRGLLKLFIPPKSAMLFYGNYEEKI